MAAQQKKKVIKSSTVRKTREPVRRKESPAKANAFTHYSDFIFSRDQYIYMGVGIVMIILGMFLMGGGHMPNDETWDPNIIYSFRRITLAPLLILAGLAFEVYVIFKK